MLAKLYWKIHEMWDDVPRASCSIPDLRRIFFTSRDVSRVKTTRNCWYRKIPSGRKPVSWCSCIKNLSIWHPRYCRLFSCDCQSRWWLSGCCWKCICIWKWRVSCRTQSPYCERACTERWLNQNRLDISWKVLVTLKCSRMSFEKHKYIWTP